MMVAEFYVIETKKKGSKHWKVWPGTERIPGLYRTRGLAGRGAKRLRAAWMLPKNVAFQVTLYIASISSPVV